MLFSVIVPIYNVEKYLPRCIESVLSQTFFDFELILVDDGSPDNCPKICENYAEKDQRIKVIHKENGGLVSARQAGIKVAQGDYIFNLDGDDALCPDALESAYKIITETNADIVSFCYNLYKNGEIGDTVYDLLDEGLYNKEDIKTKIAPNLLSNKNMNHLFYFIWGKAIKKELAIKHQLKVTTKISLGEDVCCSFPCYLEANSVYMSKKSVYLYTIRNDSLTTLFKTSQLTQLVNVIKGLRSLEIDKPLDFEEQIARYACFMSFAILAAAAEGNHFKHLKEIEKLILDSNLIEEIKKAEFLNITIKSRIAIALMKKRQIKSAFYFLNLCQKIKRILRKG